MILQIMNASSIARPYAHWEVCFPDETVLRNDGTVSELGPEYSFEECVKEGFAVSERRVALRDRKTPIIMLSNSIFKDGKCMGILSSVVDLEAFAENYLDTSYSQKMEMILFERLPEWGQRPWSFYVRGKRGSDVSFFRAGILQ